MKPIAYTLAALLAATPVSAQTWTGHTQDSGSLLFGWTQIEGHSLGFSCTAPSPQGLSLIATGSHESHRTDAFEITVNLLETLFEWQPPYVIEGIVMTVDDTSYGLPPLELNELQGSSIYLPMTDQMVLALLDAERLILDTGQGTAYNYPVDGLNAALTEVFSYCNARWVELGHALPQSLAGLTQIAPTPSPVPVASGPVPQSIQVAASEGCPGQALPVTRDDLQIADLDIDGVEDFILNHTVLSCEGGGRSGFCGAANCSIDVFLSSQNYVQRSAFLGISAGLVPLEQGRTGIQISGTYSLCGDTGLCPGPQVWNGSEFILEAPVAQSPLSPTGPKN